MAHAILIKHIKGLLQLRETPITFLSGSDMAELPVLEDAFLKIKNGLIEAYGAMRDLHDESADEVVDARGCYVLPAFVDSHTHLVFAATREEEFVMKIKGASYAEIAANGGGILNSARKLQNTSEDELLDSALKRVQEIAHLGTGAVEIKSGYGLTTADELKMLRVARKLQKHCQVKIKTTFLGAHAVPTDVKKEHYVRQVVEEMIPAVAAENLADYIDVFCEEGFFTPDESEQILEEGKKFGMTPRVHANQLHCSGGVQVGVKVGARSVDHLENITDVEIELLKTSRTMPTALPGAAFFLNLPFPPARKMLSAGLPLAIATDYNPGSSPTGNMQLMLSLACIKMRLTPEEAINAATINTAYAMGLEGTHGIIRRGIPANIIVTKSVPSVAYLPYHLGHDFVGKVFLNGHLIS